MNIPKQRVMPKGGRKGGSIFPRIGLDEAVGYAKKLVTKTHVAKQPIEVVYSGVVGTKAGLGDVRISALKQYGFLVGDRKVGFSASELAKKIASAPPEDLRQLYQVAILRPAIFKALAETFRGDVVSKARLKQRAADLKVHPEETENCVEVYVSGMTTAGLVTAAGDQISHLLDTAGERSSNEVRQNIEEPASVDEKKDSADPADSRVATVADAGLERAAKATININVTLDSSMDIDKLAKQLELLKRYGAI